MEAIDKTKLDTAITYISRMADGCNPVNNQPLAEDDALNNPNIIRCMFFVRDVLEQVRENGGSVKKAKKKTAVEAFPYEVLSQFSYREDKAVSKLVQQIYEPVGGADIKMVSGKRVMDWLVAMEYVEEVYDEELKKNVKQPTEKGTALGLRAERLVYQPTGNHYVSVLFNQQAQEFVVQNFDKILNGELL